MNINILANNKKVRPPFFLMAILLLLVAFIANGGVGAGIQEDPSEDAFAYLPLISKPLPAPPLTTISLQPFATGFTTSTITGIVSAGDERLFVLEREGLIRIVYPDGTVLPTPFLDLSERVKWDNWEEGLLGLAFHPNYANNGYFYVYYTGAGGCCQVILRRFTVSADDPNVADPESDIRLMAIPKPTEVHNGGDMHFGPDGYLYIAIGDGGPDPYPLGHEDSIMGDPNNHGQRLDVPNASILRIDVDGQSAIPPDFCTNGTFYTIPSDNPFLDGWRGKCDEIWASGLRNPWRFSFDSLTGDMYISDVGEWEYDEINFHPAGAPGGVNYGWHCYEGTLDYATIWPEVALNCGLYTYTFPIIEYPLHGPEGHCSVVGGYVYRGAAYPNLQGQYLFADFCSKQIWRVNVDQHETHGWQVVPMMKAPFNVSTFGQGADGELYIGGYLHGTIYKVVVP